MAVVNDNPASTSELCGPIGAVPRPYTRLAMLIFGLVQGDGWDGQDDGFEADGGQGPRPEHWTWRPPWRPLAWFAAWCWLMALVPVVTSAAGGLAGFGVLMLAFGLAYWRLERFCARQYWGGLREYKS